jgi:lipase chaperone LimK
MPQTVLGFNRPASRDARLKINNDLETINQVLYLVSAELSSDQARLKSFVGVGQSALRRVADAFAGLGESPH